MISFPDIATTSSFHRLSDIPSIIEFLRESKYDGSINPHD